VGDVGRTLGVSVTARPDLSALDCWNHADDGTGMTTRWARVARGWVAAVVSVFLALCSHALAGGAVPAVPGLLLCLAFASLVCIALSGKTLSVTRLSISVLISQFLFHGAFGLLATAPTASAGPDHMHMDLIVSPAPVVTMAMPDWMWLAHGVAAVVTIVALRQGERAFWSLVRLATPFVRRLLSVPTVHGHPTQHSLAFAERELPTLNSVAMSIVRHRGPPAPVAL
jgi:hypothetical protein